MRLKVVNCCPNSVVVFYGILDSRDNIYDKYNISNYSSIVAAKLDSKKTINHYSDIIEDEINSEIKAEGKKIYVLTPK